MANTDEKKKGLADLLAGTIDLGFGIRISPITDGKRLTAIRFEHDVYDGCSAYPVGVCSKVLPITTRGTFFSLQGGKLWRLIHIGRGKGLRLEPSIRCVEHNLHGFIDGGAWKTYRAYAFEHWSEEKLQERLRLAEAESEEFGGGLEGALLALASHYAGAAYAPGASKGRSTPVPFVSPIWERGYVPALPQERGLASQPEKARAPHGEDTS